MHGDYCVAEIIAESVTFVSNVDRPHFSWLIALSLTTVGVQNIIKRVKAVEAEYFTIVRLELHLSRLHYLPKIPLFA